MRTHLPFGMFDQMASDLEDMSGLSFFLGWNASFQENIPEGESKQDRTMEANTNFGEKGRGFDEEQLQSARRVE